MTPRTLCLGEALIDSVTSAAGTAEHVGGSPLNVAVGLARLGHPTTLGSWWARDARGDRIAAAMQEAGVAVEPGSDAAAFTTVAHATLDADGSASYTFELDPGVAPLGNLSRMGHLHTGSLGAVLEPGGTEIRNALATARPFATISYDPNARPTLMGPADQARDRMEALISLADIVKASDEDLAWLYPDTAIEQVMHAWAELGPALVVITVGASGALVQSRRNRAPIRVPAMPVQVSDTVGAGDSFMAGLLGGLLDAGLVGDATARDRLAQAPLATWQPAIQQAIAAAGLTVAHAGAYAPTPGEVAEVIPTVWPPTGRSADR
ncbi:MAG: carbohydrate kinase family protein [Propioniciclava sp.]